MSDAIEAQSANRVVPQIGGLGLWETMGDYGRQGMGEDQKDRRLSGDSNGIAHLAAAWSLFWATERQRVPPLSLKL